MIIKKLYLFLIIVLFPLVANADSVEIDGLYYALNPNDKTAKVVSTHSEDDSWLLGVRLETPNPSSNEKSLENITIPDSVTYEGVVYRVTSIGEGAFLWCSGLKMITIGSNVSSIGERVFVDCTDLRVIVSRIKEPFDINPNCWYGVKKDSLQVYVPINTQNKYYTKNGWKDIYKNNNFFEIGGKDVLTDGDTFTTFVGSVLTTIRVLSTDYKTCEINKGKGVLKNTTFIIPSSITGSDNNQYTIKTIMDGAFSGCMELISVDIPDGVTSIGNYAFSVCSNLKSVSIPNSVNTIGENAFSGFFC